MGLCFEQTATKHHVYLYIYYKYCNGHFDKNLGHSVSQGETGGKKSRCFLKSRQCVNQQTITICDNKGSVCLCNFHRMTESTVKVMNNARLNYFSPTQPMENPCMEFSVNELNSQMFQHLVNPFGICQGRKHPQVGPDMLSPLCLPAQLGPSKDLAFSLSKISI